MRCQEVRSLIKNYHTGSLDEYTRIRVHHHLADCKSCTEDFDIWVRGEEYMKTSTVSSSSLTTSTSSAVMNNVMGRIKKEEKWANPSTNKGSTYSKRTKKIVSFAFSMLFIFFVLFSATMLTPQYEDIADPVVDIKMFQNSWDINKIVLTEPTHAEETSMNFRVVASLSDPIIYTLPSEGKDIPYAIIFSVFGILCIILGMSWVTRV
jgi:hypothetical protein